MKYSSFVSNHGTRFFFFHGVRYTRCSPIRHSTLFFLFFSSQKAGGIHPAGHPVVVPLCTPVRIMNYIFLFHRSIDYNIFLLSIKSKRERKEPLVLVASVHPALSLPVPRVSPCCRERDSRWGKGLKGGGYGT